MSTESRGLIVDVGMHRGDDTAFYLAKGFDVLAIEANPQLVEQVGEKLRPFVEQGRLTIEQVAITDHVGEVSFFVSDEDLWGSTDAQMASRGLERGQREIRVPSTTLDRLLADRPTPHYVKIDIEGRDPDCVVALGNLEPKPRYVSFEADLTDADETTGLIARLADYGYRRFKLVNQATHARTRMPQPAVEGEYVEVAFTKHMSGPFGEESVGEWLTAEEVTRRYLETCRQQAVRIGYSARGTVLGVPVRVLHKPLMWLYNTAPVTAARVWYSQVRGVEVGGWFDVHASL